MALEAKDRRQELKKTTTTKETDARSKNRVTPEVKTEWRQKFKKKKKKKEKKTDARNINKQNMYYL